MESPIHSLKQLFDQLGLDSEESAIRQFAKNNQLESAIALEDAQVWKPWQIDFLRDARAQDADWSEPVDELDALLHRSSMTKKP